MISIIKDLFSNQVGSAVILTIIGAITKKYIQFHRRDFFSRSSSEQIKAVEWLRTSSVPISDPLARRNSSSAYSRSDCIEIGIYLIKSYA